MASTPVLFSQGVSTVVDSRTPTAAGDGLPYAPMLKDTTQLLLGVGIGDPNPDATAGAWVLSLPVTATFDGTPQLAVYAITSSWQSAVGWADRPTHGTALDTVTGALSSGDTLTFNVAADVSSRLAGAVRYGYAVLRLDTGTAGTLGTFVAPGDSRPSLLGEFVTSPDAPTGLSPAFGGVVGEAKPVLSMDFGDGDITAVQVHFKLSNTGWTSAGGFSSPWFDSGTVATTDPELDLSTTAISALTVQDYYWTARCEDANGWSAWATPVVFAGYRAKVAVAITSPSGGAVSDPGPEYLWAVTGGTQTAYQVFTYPQGVRTKPLDVSKKTASAVGGYTPIPKANTQLASYNSGAGVFLEDSAPMTVEVRVWDAVANRVATPGCPEYSVVTADYAFFDNETVDPPDDLTVLRVGYSPWADMYVTITSGPPAYFIFMRDGVHIARKKPENLESFDNGEGGTTYVWRDWGAQGGYQHTWGVKRVAVPGHGGGTSNALEYVAGPWTVEGVWFGGPITGTVGWVSGIGSSHSIQDQVGFLETLGVGYPVVSAITQGAVFSEYPGTIVDAYGVTASEWHKALRDLWHDEPFVRIAHTNVSYDAFIYNVHFDPFDESVSPYDKKPVVQAVQLGPFSVVDEPPNFGQPTVDIWDFEELVDGSIPADGDAIVRADSGDDGTPGIIDRDGKPQFSDTAAEHGDFGFDLGWRS